MSDLVERLRRVPPECRCGGDRAEVRQTCPKYGICTAKQEAAARIEALEAENARLREAVDWYGENARLARLITSEGDPGRNNLAGDGGKRARAALAGKAVIAPAEKTGMDEILREQAARDVFPRPSRRAMAEAPKKTGE